MAVGDRGEYERCALVPDCDGDPGDLNTRLITNHAGEHRRLRSGHAFDFEFDLRSMSLEPRLLTSPGTECKGRETAQCRDQGSRDARRPPPHRSHSRRAVAGNHRTVGAPIQTGADASLRPQEKLAHFIARHLREVVDIETAERAVTHPLIAGHSLPAGLARHGDTEMSQWIVCTGHGVFECRRDERVVCQRRGNDRLRIPTVVLEPLPTSFRRETLRP